MTPNNDSLEDRVKKLEDAQRDGKNDRGLIKRLIRLLVDAWKASRGQENKALNEIDQLLRDDEKNNKGGTS